MLRMPQAGHPREGQPVQRRVSYRRPRDADDSSSSDGSESLLLQDRDADDSSSMMAAPPIFNDRCGEDEILEDDRHGELINLFSSSLLAPRSLWHEVWLAFRYG